MKRFALLFGMTLVSVACVNQILDDDYTPDDRNIVLQHYFYFGDGLMNSNRTHEMGNAEVLFTDCALVVGGYWFEDQWGDTLHTAGEPVAFDPGVAAISRDPVRVAYAEKGLYTGGHRWTLGLDSAQQAVNPGGYGTEHPLAHEGLFKGDGEGYHGLVIRGKYRELTDTIDTIPTTDFYWAVPAENFADVYHKNGSFNIGFEGQVNINVVIRMDSVLNGFDPTLLDEIIGNTGDPIDDMASDYLRDQFVNYYKVQL